MPIPRILGFAGPAGVGKDKAASAVQEAFGHEPTSIADLLKDIAARCYDVDVSVLEDARVALRAGRALTDSQRRKIESVRQMLWRIGDAMKTVDPDCLMRGALRFADMSVPLRAGKPPPKSCVADGLVLRPKVVFTDVRNPNEVRMIRERGGEVIRLVGPSLWGKPPSGDSRIEDLNLPVLDVSAAAETSITLLRAGSAEPDRPFNGRVIGFLVEKYGGDEFLDSDLDMSETSDVDA